MKRSVGIVDVSRLAGVSVGTVSRVLNGHPSVKDKTRRCVMEAIKELNYQPNMIARSLKTNSTKTIGVLIPDIANEFYADVVRGAESVAEGSGFSYILNSTKSSTEKELHAIGVMREKQVDGIMMMSHTVAPQMLEYIQSNSISAVLVASALSHPSIATVSIDDHRAAYDAVRHLLTLGHRRIAAVGGPEWDVNGGAARLAGYRQAMAECDLPIPDGYIQNGSDYTYRTGYEKMCRFLDLPEPPTAVFLAGDYMAVGALSAADQHGLSVPDDIAVMGFDNLAISQYYTPSLSTVNQPRYQMGQEAMRLLFARIAGEALDSFNIVLPHEVLPRRSTLGGKDSPLNFQKM